MPLWAYRWGCFSGLTSCLGWGAQGMATRQDCPVLPHTYCEGDQAPEIQFTLEKTDLTGETVEVFLERNHDTKIDLTVVPIDLTIGRFKITWGATDLLEGNGQLVTVTKTDGSGRRICLGHFRINVAPNPDPTP